MTPRTFDAQPRVGFGRINGGDIILTLLLLDFEFSPLPPGAPFLLLESAIVSLNLKICEGSLKFVIVRDVLN